MSEHVACETMRQLTGYIRQKYKAASKRAKQLNIVRLYLDRSTEAHKTLPKSASNVFRVDIYVTFLLLR